MTLFFTNSNRSNIHEKYSQIFEYKYYFKSKALTNMNMNNICKILYCKYEFEIYSLGILNNILKYFNVCYTLNP